MRRRHECTGDNDWMMAWIIGFTIVALVFLMCIVYLTTCSAPVEQPQEPPATEQPAQGEPGYPAYSWSDDDLQGEWSPLVAATHILLRADGIDSVTRGRLTEVYAPLEQDYPSATWSIDVAEALSPELPDDLVAIPLVGALPGNLPTPALVWLSDGASLRPEVLLGYDGDTVTYVDPTRGVVEMPADGFDGRYDEAFRQVVYIAPR